MSVHHANDVPACPLCEQKLKQAHPQIAAWFRDVVKPAFPEAHVSWSFRDQKSQNEACAEGKSKLPWPKSAHNACDASGVPCAKALDLFQLASNGMALWHWNFFKQISVLLTSDMKWGGIWKELGDFDHFSL